MGSPSGIGSSRRRVLGTIVLAIAGATVAASSSARAAFVISFDPNGTSGATTLSVVTFDQLPGNALAVDVIDTSTGTLKTTPFVLLYQAKVGVLLNSTNTVVAVPGLTTAGELTVVAKFFEVVTGISLSSATFSTSTSQVGSFIEIYFDPANNANDLTGTGFDDGTLIYRGTILGGGGGAYAITNPTTPALDQHVANNYPGISTVFGGGGSIIRAFTTFFHPSFFLTGMTNTVITFDTQNNTPFTSVNPSAMMFDGTPAATVASIGSLNGVDGPNFLFMSDASSTFDIVPEPTTFLAGLLGIGAVLGVARRRRSTAA